MYCYYVLYCCYGYVFLLLCIFIVIVTRIVMYLSILLKMHIGFPRKVPVMNVSTEIEFS
jgi:hypothetical protein